MNIIDLSAGLGAVETVIIIVAALALIVGGVFAFLAVRRKSAKKTVKAQQPAEKKAPVKEVKSERPADIKETVKEEKVDNIPALTEETAGEADDAEEERDEEIMKIQTPRGEVRYIVIKYKKSFTAKLIQSSDTVKEYYSQIKNELLSYKGVKSRLSWRYETFNAGRQKIAKMAIRGKSLSLFLALNPAEFADSKYIIVDKSEVAAYESTPLLYRIKNDRRLNYSKELIARANEGRVKLDIEAHDYKADYPYEETEPLIERGLIKVLTDEDAQSGNAFKPRNEVTVGEVNDLIKDEAVVKLIKESKEYSDKSKVEIVNVDVLGRYFEDGETVTLEEVKKRVPKFPKNTTYLKVLARGYLDKQLHVVADSFSIEAAKMIILTGGTVEKKKVK
ncbi:MAG: uL15 family ribosomal protein [Clostridia bacterium]|nr:uL15 family ribosomal protein [Clostridia bacterium]